MALIKCPECGKEISDKAGKCPNCGFPLDNVYNKADQPMPSTINNNVPLSKTKILIISAIVILIIASIGVIIITTAFGINILM